MAIAGVLTARPAIAEIITPQAFADQDRTAAGPRAVVIAVPQPVIETEVEIGRVISDAAYGGGLLGALINTSTDHKREALNKLAEDRAGAVAAPLRAELTDFDFAALAGQSARTAFGQVEWFHAGEVQSVGTLSEADRATLAGKAGPGQLVTAAYHYATSPDFTQVRVWVDLFVLRSAHSNEPPKVLFQQKLAVIAELRKRSYDHAENVVEWSGAHGALVRASVATALAHLEHMIPFALNLSPAALSELEKAKADKVFAAGFYGAPIHAVATAPGETLLWKHGLIDVFEVSGGDAVAAKSVTMSD